MFNVKVDIIIILSLLWIIEESFHAVNFLLCLYLFLITFVFDFFIADLNIRESIVELCHFILRKIHWIFLMTQQEDFVLRLFVF